MDYANLTNLSELESLYQRFLQDPTSVDPSWRYFFEGMALGASSMPSAEKGGSPDLRIYLLIDAYRKFGHLMARFNPVETKERIEPEELKLSALGFQESERQLPFPTCGFLPEKSAPLQTIVDALKKTYCGQVGFEYMDLANREMEKWIQSRIEPFFPLQLDGKERLEIYNNLNRAELFESFLHTKYVGQKRFSLEGAETLIPMLSALIDKGRELSIREAVLGMAHRGRLNVLANILNKSYATIFREFETFYAPGEFEGTGDVKYHKGFVGDLHGLQVTLVANPSHLESVDPVVEGIVRAKQQVSGREAQKQEILPILIHGDAAVAGQGVVYETLQFSGLNGYGTGGTLHIVINNQIGFTTLPKDSRSTRYCTEIAKAFNAPVFHVNAEDPESCVRIAKLAIEIRQKFGCDVFIDLNGYRKYGHNESDEPTFTQPLEYALIKGRKTARELFLEQLVKEGVLDASSAASYENAFRESLERALETVQSAAQGESERSVAKEPAASKVRTAVDAKTLVSLAERFCMAPEQLRIHPKIQRLLQERLAMVRSDKASIDWGMGEMLAYATLLEEKIHVRLSGQDVRRGTFSHRHAVWVDQVKEERYFPLSHLSYSQAPFDVFNSHLSEFAVLGFEFGYSLAYPQSLVIWEAQFGDFANGAQVIIDQYIASAEQKWNLSTNLTLLLPHGYEGQGPEHSSARIERFLQLAGHENMRIANCSTPSQLFHILRAQALLAIKKPLVLFTPKALLRHPACVSSIRDLAEGSFQEVIEDGAIEAKRLLFCSGKIYYELLAEREKKGLQKECGLIRIEELYPFPKERVQKVLENYRDATQFFWVQEEHSNMGPWEYVRPHLAELLGAKGSLQYIGRDRSASPAAGSHALHKKQADEILMRAYPT
ncbi:MAG: 2-oxoglutarate dehydrogenase E1 component [Verrucomicrobia bacterium]|nr:2-oxoglutarate dehydrogenase E1 component [Verrucomicrobiota bacterium]